MSKSWRNEELFRAMEDLRRGSAAQPHEDGRTKRARTRLDADNKAIQDSFEDDEEVRFFWETDITDEPNEE